MSSRLVPCDGCQRHVRAAEAECPFCGAAVVVGPAGPEVRVPRMNRAALFAFGAAAAGVVALTGCSDDSSSMPLYGAPPGDSSLPDGMAGDAAVDTSLSDTSIAPAYGAPADTGTDASDAGDPDTSVAPAYGAPADAG